MKTPRLTPEWDRTCPHIKDEAGRSYVCAGCAKDVLAARDAEHSRRTELAREVLREFSGRAAGGAMWCPCCSRTVDDCATRNNIGARARAALQALEGR